MGDFYLCSRPFIIFCMMLSALSIGMQTVSLSQNFRVLRRTATTKSENILEFAVLIQQMTMIRLLAEASYYMSCGIVYTGRHTAERYLIFLLIAVLAMKVSWKKRLFWPMLIVPAAALTLPVIEPVSGGLFPLLYILSMVYLLVRASRRLFVNLKAQRKRLSAFSVKEAVDSLDTGLLFFAKNGQILLQNRRMQTLVMALTGEYQYNGLLFFRALQNGEVLPECEKDEIGRQIAYRLKDGSVWVFTLHDIAAGNLKCVLLAAYDATERWKATRRLWEQNQELEKRNRELKKMLENLETICEAEATIHAKSRVHDVLGQRISLLLRAMREHREPDEVLLHSFAEGLPQELTDATADGGHSLDTLAEVFRGLGVHVRVDGWLPDQEDTARALYEVAAEAVTNAVRHGYATEVEISILNDAKSYIMDVRDNGLPVDAPINEGGGLTEMRRKVTAFGGVFRYAPSSGADSSGGFHIHVEIPKGEAQ